MTVGERIVKVRKEKGIPQKELAEKLGVSSAMIAQYESGRRTPSQETLVRISALLDVPYYSLVDLNQISLEQILKFKEDELLYLEEERASAIKAVSNLHELLDWRGSSESIKSINADIQKYNNEIDLLKLKIKKTINAIINLREIVTQSLTGDDTKLNDDSLQKKINAYKEEYINAVYNATNPISDISSSKYNPNIAHALSAFDRVTKKYQLSRFNTEGQKIAVGYIRQLKEQLELLEKIPEYQATQEIEESDMPDHATSDELLRQMIDQIIFQDDGSSNNQE
jgi:transcriptional regulator with XRE-family HTH domain